MSPEPSTVLLVEDEPQVLRLLRELLVRAGYRVLAFPRGLAALECVEEGERPDVVAVDVGLPDLPGPELIFSLRRVLPSLPVLVLSGRPRDMAELPADLELVFLSKPFRPRELLEALEMVIASGARAG